MLENIGGESIRVVHPLFPVEGGGSIPTSPLHLHVGEIHVVKAIDLNQLWHSRLPNVIRGNIDRNRHSVCFGAEYAGKFYASAIWSTPVADNLLKTSGYCLELRRFAIANDAPKNTASRMLSVMVKLIRKKFPEIVRLVSYQDTVAHLGTIYKAAGWRQTAALSKGRSWSVNGRSRNPEQSIANKIRWERNIKYRETTK